MTSNLKFTPWFTKGETPSRIGVYQASCKKENQTGDWYSYWNGEDFCSFSENVAQAKRYGLDRSASSLLTKKRGSWRGLATQTGK